MKKWFKKESRELRQKITTRVMIISLAVIALAVSGTVLMAGWVDDNGDNSNEIIYTDPATGNVGIGTANPSFKLDVAGFFRADNFVMSPLNASNYLDFYYYTQNAGTKTLRFYGNGGGSTLNIQLVDGSLTVAGTTTSALYKCSSDVRYKKDISPYQNALKKVLGLQGVNYFWKTDEFKDHSFSKDKQIGFVAQEVEKVIPELVSTDDKGYKAMSYDRLTVVLVEAVKEIKAEKDSEIAALKQENKQLKEELASLKSMSERILALEKAVKSYNIGMK